MDVPTDLQKPGKNNSILMKKVLNLKTLQLCALKLVQFWKKKAMGLGWIYTSPMLLEFRTKHQSYGYFQAYACPDLVLLAYEPSEMKIFF